MDLCFYCRARESWSTIAVRLLAEENTRLTNAHAGSRVSSEVDNGKTQHHVSTDGASVRSDESKESMAPDKLLERSVMFVMINSSI